MKNDAGTKSIRKKIAAWNQLKQTLPTQLGNLAVSEFKKNFRDQGFDGKAWQPRKDTSNKNRGRAILIKSGNLRNSIILKYARWPVAYIVSNTPYSAIHNYGKQGLAWGKHRFKMPQRKFMGQSNELDKKTILLMRQKINRALGI